MSLRSNTSGSLDPAGHSTGQTERRSACEIPRCRALAGAYLLCLCVLASSLGAATADGPAKYLPPTVSLDAPATARVGDLITLASALSEPNASVRYRFVYSDIAPSESDWSSKPKTYRLLLQPGEFTVYVQAGHLDGQKVYPYAISPPQTITVLPALPTVALSTSTKSPKAGQIVVWKVSRKPDGPLDYEFNPGDDTGTVRSTQPTIEHVYRKDGRFNATVRLLNEENQPTARQPVRIAAAPTPTLDVAPASVEIGHSVAFTAKYQNGNAPVRFRFNFGDGTAPTPWGAASRTTHSYATSGTFRAVVETTTNKNPDAPAESESRAVSVTVQPPLTVSIEQSRSGARVGNPIDFRITTNRTETSPHVTVDFGDGSSSGPVAPGKMSHVFRKAQSYQVIALAESKVGKASATLDITIDPVPTPRLEVSRSPAEIGESVRFTVSYPAADRRTRYRFNFGDGSEPTPWAKALTSKHAYSNSGTFSASAEVAVTIPAEAGNEPLAVGTSAAREIEILPALEVAIRPVTSSPHAGDPVEFSITTTRPELKPTFTVTFDDDAKATAVTAGSTSHIFALPGKHFVRVEAKAKSRTAAGDTIIVVEPFVPPALTAQPTPAELNEPVELVATLPDTASQLRYRFDFNDGTQPSGWFEKPQASHTFSDTGKFRPSIEVGLSRGNTIESLAVRSETEVEVLPPLEVTLRPEDTEIVAGRDTSFAVETNRPGATISIEGTFGDNTPIVSRVAGTKLKHTFAKKGTYLASWTARSGRAVAHGELTLTVGSPSVDWVKVVLLVVASIGAVAAAGFGAHRLGWLRPSLHPRWNMQSLHAESKHPPQGGLEFILNPNMESLRCSAPQSSTTSLEDQRKHHG